MDVLDHIIVSVDELYEQVKLMRADGIEYVELAIAPPDEFDGETMPARLDLSGLMPGEPSGSVGYDSIDAAEI